MIGGSSEVNVLMSEIESIRQERDILHDELRSNQHVLENVRAELAVRNHFLLSIKLTSHCFQQSVCTIIVLIPAKCDLLVIFNFACTQICTTMHYDCRCTVSLFHFI